MGLTGCGFRVSITSPREIRTDRQTDRQSDEVQWVKWRRAEKSTVSDPHQDHSSHISHLRHGPHWRFIAAAVNINFLHGRKMFSLVIYRRTFSYILYRRRDAVMMNDQHKHHHQQQQQQASLSTTALTVASIQSSVASVRLSVCPRTKRKTTRAINTMSVKI